MNKKDKLAIIRGYIDEHGLDINKANGLKLPLDPNVKEFDGFNKDEKNMWFGSTIDVITYSDKGIGYLYYHKEQDKWYVKGYAPYDVEYDKKRQKIADKFITIEQYNSIKYK